MAEQPPEPDSPAQQAAEALLLAALLQAGVRKVSKRLVTVLLGLWQQVPAEEPAKWVAVLPEAVGAFRAAQTTAAAMADVYVEAIQHAGSVSSVRAAIAAARKRIDLPAFTVDAADVLAAQLVAAGVQVVGQGSSVPLVVNPAALAGATGSGLTVEELLAVPAGRAGQALLGAARPELVKVGAGHALRMYAETEIPDAARSATQVAMVTKRVDGYIRHVGARCCSRCAILSGRWYRWSAGFSRHPYCRCVHVPASRDVDVVSPAQLFREGRITDLTVAERRAVELGADLSAVVNSRQGMYVAGRQSFTVQGTTRRGIAGARMLAAQIHQASGGAPGQVFANYTISRSEVAQAEAKYGPLMRRGVPFLRSSPLGGSVESSYRFTSTQRPTVRTILDLASTREEATRLLINYGYIVNPAPGIRSIPA